MARADDPFGTLYRVDVQRSATAERVKVLVTHFPRSMAQAVADGFNLAERFRPAGLRAVVTQMSPRRGRMPRKAG
jgi:hypothetical protein